MGTSLIIEIDNCTPGMVLSVDLLDSHGSILLPGQTILTAALISSLKRHEVSEISIQTEGQEVSDDSQQKRRNLEKQIARINLIFQTHENHVPNQQLKSYLINFISAGAQ